MIAMTTMLMLMKVTVDSVVDNDGDRDHVVVCSGLHERRMMLRGSDVGEFNRAPVPDTSHVITHVTSRANLHVDNSQRAICLGGS